MKEIWKTYLKVSDVECSTLGNLRRKHDKHVYSQNTSPNGYRFIRIKRSGKIILISVHRAIAETFLPNPEMKPEVNHIDGVRSNNQLDNLEWCTSSENSIHSYKHLNRSRPKGVGIKVMCVESGTIYSSYREAARNAFISDVTIRKHLLAGTPCNGFHWRLL